MLWRHTRLLISRWICGLPVSFSLRSKALILCYIIDPHSPSTLLLNIVFLDAGHIAIESDLTAKDVRNELDEKLKQSYDLEDYK